jgi:hypothetical protein
MAKDSPKMFVEPPIPIATPVASVPAAQAIIRQLDQGNFRQPALLTESMLWNPRLRAVTNTRLAGLIAAKIRFDPVRNNRDARRAAREFSEDWKTIASTPMRKQFIRWAWFLGVSFAQRAFAESPTSGRQIFKLRPYWPGFASWYWAIKSYRIQTFDKGVTDAMSPAHEDDGNNTELEVLSPLYAQVVKPEDSPWIIAEPFGVNSYRDGLVHACWRSVLGHELSIRDQARASEKHGIGIVKAFYPRGQGDEHKAAISRFTDGLRGKMGSEGVVPLERRKNSIGPGDEPGDDFDIEPFEFTGTGGNAIDSTLTTCAVALAILWLGHNLTTEIKNGGSYAAAGVGEYIRDDIKNEDAETEWSVFGPQVAAPYCLLNYGDPELAPIAVYETDSTAVNQAAATMTNAIAQAITQLRMSAPNVDIDALCERFQLPLLVLDKERVQVPAAVAAPPAPVAQPPVPTENK